MPQTISQNLTLPSNVTAGGTIQAADVSTLYTTLNAFSIPDTIASLIQSAYSTNSAQTLTGGTSTAASNLDLAINVPANRVLLHIGSYSWATTGVQLQLQYRLNGTAIALPSVIATSTSGSGIFFVVHGPHDATAARPVVGWQTASTGVIITFTANADLPTVASTSIGIGALFGTATNGSTGSTVTLNFTRVWRET